MSELASRSAGHAAENASSTRPRFAECKKYIRARPRAARIHRYTTRMHVRNIPALERATDMANQPVPHAPRASARAPFERNAHGRGGARAAQAARDRGGVLVRVQRCAMHVQRRGAHKGAAAHERRGWRVAAAACGCACRGAQYTCRGAERTGRCGARGRGRQRAARANGGCGDGTRGERSGLRAGGRAGGRARTRAQAARAAAACWCACRGAQCTCRGAERTRARAAASGAGGA